MRGRRRTLRSVTLGVLLMAALLAAPLGPAAQSAPPGTCLGFAVNLAGATDGDDVVVGTSGDDVIHLGDGNDTFDGNGGDDIACGGSGADILRGGAGNDSLQGGPGDDTLDGEGGVDEADYSEAAGPVTADVDFNGDGTVTGEGTDTLTDVEGIRGTPFGDDLTAPRVTGGPGDDTLDANEVDFSTAAGGVTVDLSTVPGTATGDGSDTIGTGFFAVFGVTRVRGTPFADDITGRTAGFFVYTGDVIAIPGAGDDTVTDAAVDYGGFTLFSSEFARFDGPPARPGDFAGAPGPVTIDLPAGQATGAWGTDTLVNVADAFGSEFGDTLTGTAERNVLLGLGGDDTINGGAGDDRIHGGFGNDTLDGGDGDDTIIGDGVSSTGAATTFPSAFPAGTIAIGKDALPDDPQDFGFTGDLGAFSLDDDADATLPNQFVSGAGLPAGDYTITEAVPAGWTLLSITCAAAGASTSSVDLDAASVTVSLAAGDVVVCTFSDGRRDDTITAGAGDDRIEPRAGDDSVDGGPGTDLLAYTGFNFDAPGPVDVDLAAGTAAGQSTDTITVGTVENVIGTEHADTLRGDGGPNVLNGLGGDDTLDGRGGTDEAVFIVDRPALDTFGAPDSAVTADLGAGTATGADQGSDTLIAIENLTGSGGDDTLVGDAGDNVLRGSIGDDLLHGKGGDDTLDGGFNDFGPGTGDTVTYADAPGPVTVDLQAGTATGSSTDVLLGVEHAIGGPFADTLLGGSGNNELSGLAGDDFLDGRFGVDTMDGGADTDECVFTKGLVETLISCETTTEGPEPPAGTTDATEVGANDFRISDIGPSNDGSRGVSPFDSKVDIAYNATANQYLVVWIGDDAADETYDVFGQLIDGATGAEVGVDDFPIGDMGSGDDIFTDVAVAYNSVRNEYLVAFSADKAGTFDHEVFVQRVTAAGAEIGADDAQISSVSWLTGTFGLDVAHNPNDDEYLVAFSTGDDTPTPPMADDEREVLAQRLTGDGLEVGADDFRISDVNGIGLGPDTTSLFGGIAVAHNATANEYLVTWTARDDAVDFDRQLPYGQRLSTTGAEVGPNDFLIADMAGAAAFASASDAAWNSVRNEWYAVWEGRVGDDFEGGEIFGRRMAADGTPLDTLQQISSLGPPGDPDLFARLPSIDYDATHDRYFVGFAGVGPGQAPSGGFPSCFAGECEVFGQWLSGNPAEIGPDDVRLTDMGADGDPAFGADLAVVAYNSTDNEWLLAFRGRDFPLADGETEVYGQRVRFPGTIVVVKDAVPDGPQDFTFNGTGGIGAFVLDDDGDPAVSNTANLSDLTAGTYTITESVPAGWSLSSIVCDDPTAVVDLDAGSVTVDVSLDEIVTCTFTNAPVPPSGVGRCEFTDVTPTTACLSFGKLVDPADGTVFDYQSAQLGAFSLVGEPLVNAVSSSPIQFSDLAPGTFSVTELPEPGFFPTGTLACDGQFDPADIAFGDQTITVDLEGGEFANCDFFNNRHALTITKAASPADGTVFSFSSAALGDFTLQDGDSQQFFVATDTPVTITETAPAGWEVESIDCTINDPPAAGDDPDGGFGVTTFTSDIAAGTLDVEFGDLDSRQLTCTFTNAELPDPPPAMGTVTIVKDAVPDDAQDFVFSGDLGGFTLDDDADITRADTISFTVAPGSYDVVENVPVGWDVTDIRCVDPDGGSAVSLATATATVDLDADETVTCVFVNEKEAPPAPPPPEKGTVRIVKDAVPDGPQDFGFSGDLGSFVLDDDADATLPASRTFSVDVGTYAVSEAVPAGWDLTALTCDDADSTVSLPAATATVRVAANETVTCVFVNTAEGFNPETVGLHDPSNGWWHLLNSQGVPTVIVYGNPADQPFMGDWDCDGVDTPGLFRPVDGPEGTAGKVYLRNSNSTGIADVEYFFGNPNDFAVPGDWDGDGCDTVGLFRADDGDADPATGRMFVTNRLGSGNVGIGAAEIEFAFGSSQYPPFAGDFDGDREAELGYYVPDSAGESLNVFLFMGLGNGTPDETFLYGNPDDVGFVGDWDGDGDDTIGVFRTADRFGPTEAAFYLRNSNTTGIGNVVVDPFGQPDWNPLHGKFGLG